MMEAGHNPFDQKYFYRDTLSDGELDQDDEFINNYHMGQLVSQNYCFRLKVKERSRFLLGVTRAKS